MKNSMSVVLLFGVILLCVSCAATKTEKVQTATKDASAVIQCEEPRPQICTREYRPVCATRFTGTQCVTTPCPATEEKTYATGCTACADAKVIEYSEGACE